MRTSRPATTPPPKVSGGEILSPARPLRLRRRRLGHLAESADSLAFGAHILRMADMLAGDFGWNLGRFGPFWRANRACRWRQGGSGAEMLRWARPNRALFLTFFTFWSELGPNWCFLTPFLPPTHADVMMHPRACFAPSHRPCSMRPRAPDCQNGRGRWLIFGFPGFATRCCRRSGGIRRNHRRRRC